MMVGSPSQNSIDHRLAWYSRQGYNKCTEIQPQCRPSPDRFVIVRSAVGRRRRAVDEGCPKR